MAELDGEEERSRKIDERAEMNKEGLKDKDTHDREIV